MKKIIVFVTLIFICVVSYGQIYTAINYLDRFDDSVKEEKVKTIVGKTDSTFVVETKGRTPQVYRIMMANFLDSAGSDEETVNLYNDVYGYQESWFVMKESDFHRWVNDGTLPAGEFLLTAVHRVIRTQYTNQYVCDFFWICDEKAKRLGNGINRIVYWKGN